MKKSPTGEKHPVRKEVVPTPFRSTKWVAVAVVAVLGCLAVIVGGSKVRAYFTRRTSLTPEWERAFQRSSVQSDGVNLVSAGDFTPVQSFSHMVVWYQGGTQAGDWFGYSVEALGDLNGDGFSEVSVGAHQNENYGVRPAPNAPPGYVMVYSGVDGKLLHEIQGEGSMHIDGADDHFGYTVSSIGDMDLDGVPDIAVGAYLFDSNDRNEETFDENTGAVLFFSGATGDQLGYRGGELWGDRFGFAIAKISDRDGDQIEDILVGVEKGESTTGIKNAGRIEVMSSSNQEITQITDGPGWEAHFGCSVTSMGDVDRDGVDDFAAGAFKYAAFDEQYFERGAAGIVSGKTGEVIRAWQGAKAGDRLGMSVANLGDVDGDGVDDLAIGGIQSGLLSDYTGPGFVTIRSGATGKEIVRMEGATPGQQFGWSLSTASDWDGDGINDLWIGAPASITVGPPLGKKGTVYLVSGKTGAVLSAVLGNERDDQFGTSATEVGDLTGDGIPEVFVGAPQNSEGQRSAGYAVMLSGQLFKDNR
jgi:hypothetical protein